MEDRFSLQNDSEITDIDPMVDPVPEEPLLSKNPLRGWITLGCVVWLIGMAGMLLYALLSFGMLKRRGSHSKTKRIAKQIYECDAVDTPFILGIFHPVIYLPTGMDASARKQVLLHERMHLKRGDHYWKPLGFFILAVYWFHPLCWISYILFCRDIEFACDERVTRKMNQKERADYCQVLLNCSLPRKAVSACPVAFGEVGVKERITSILNYRKPALWLILLALGACSVIGLCFATNPKREETQKAEVVTVESEQENTDRDVSEESDSEISVPEELDSEISVPEEQDQWVLLEEEQQPEEQTPENVQKPKEQMPSETSEVAFGLQNSKNSDGTPSLAYIETLQEEISKDMQDGKLPFVNSSAVMENPNRLQVQVNDMSEENLAILHAYEQFGEALEIVQSEGQVKDLLE
jgi:hypothetical protein